MPIMKKLKEKLKELRKKTCRTQENLARKIGGKPRYLACRELNKLSQEIELRSVTRVGE